MTNTHNGTFRICKEVTISYRDFITTILSDGIQHFLRYGFYIDWDKDKFRDAKDKLIANKLDRTLESIYAEMIIAGEIDIDEYGNIDNRESAYLEGLYYRGDDIFWDEVRSQLDYMIEEDDEPITYERVAKWLHFMTDADLYDLIMEYEDKLVK